MNSTTANKELTAGKTLNRKNNIVNRGVYSALFLASLIVIVKTPIRRRD